MHFFPEKCDLNSICVLCAEGKYPSVQVVFLKNHLY